MKVCEFFIFKLILWRNVTLFAQLNYFIMLLKRKLLYIYFIMLCFFILCMKKCFLIFPFHSRWNFTWILCIFNSNISVFCRLNITCEGEVVALHLYPNRSMIPIDRTKRQSQYMFVNRRRRSLDGISIY